jgi:hypothetical protein
VCERILRATRFINKTDLFGIVVSFPELLAHDLDDVVGMLVVLREDECLRKDGTLEEDFW